jgi:hypothetical protein
MTKNVFEFNLDLINNFEFHQALCANISINEPRFSGNIRVDPGWLDSGAPIYGRLIASPSNIRLGSKGLLNTNTLTYLAPL